MRVSTCRSLHCPEYNLNTALEVITHNIDSFGIQKYFFFFIIPLKLAFRSLVLKFTTRIELRRRNSANYYLCLIDRPLLRKKRCIVTVASLFYEPY